MPRSITPRSPVRLCFTFLTALFVGLAGIHPVRSQPSPPPPEAAPQPRDNPGLVNEIGKLLKDSGSLLTDPGSLLPSFVRPDSKPDAPAAAAAPEPSAQPQPSAQPASMPAAQPAAPAVASPIVPAMINGRQVCPTPAGGAADCAAAAIMLCRTKGYQQGRSLAVDATEKCSAKVLIPGRAREPGDCRTENFVTRAWCQ
ncbi:hypothetical protein LPW26_24025 [Rhodopseudomonas sp. HC1]|uniref:hypothetical protein n=1 Tax=Rhodopseudomonas infernalis TaxID=2897386 RepID=UPI001EE93C6A|nr:hypothetical protein [Rhodopseudomonas infernalis]MCG6207727.1 hypothetical protein [Rhodopseudomonas infernalis]